ncbi:hypothetical protein D1872_321710 [compost metagenome]
MWRTFRQLNDMILSIDIQLRKLAVEFTVYDMKIMQLVRQQCRVSCRAFQQTQMIIQFPEVHIIFFHFRI